MLSRSLYFGLMLASSSLFAADRLMWTFKSPGPSNIVTFSPVGSGKGASVAMMTYGTFHGDHPFQYLLDAKTGKELWSARPAAGLSAGAGWGDECLKTTVDISADSRPELLVGTAWGNRSMFTLDGSTGRQMWNFSTYTNPYATESGWITDVERFQDLDKDGIPEVLFGVTQKNNSAYVVNGKSGEMIWQFASAYSSILSVTAIPDINGDGIMDAFVGTGNEDGKAFMIDGSAKGIAREIWNADLDTSVFTTTVAGDLNGNGTFDPITGDWKGRVVAFEGKNGQALWTANIGAYVMRIVPVKDLDGDKVQDLIVAQIANRVSVVSGKSGKVIWEQTVDSDPNTGYIWAVDAIRDINGDGIDDVVAGSFNANVYAFSGKDGKTLWTYNTGKTRIMTIRAVPDVDGDGIDEVVAGTQYLHYGDRTGGGTVFMLRGNVPKEQAAVAVKAQALHALRGDNPFSTEHQLVDSLKK